jgi:hypothetical protein
MNNLLHAVADIKKMLNATNDTSIRLSDRNIAWKILLLRSAFFETIYDQEFVPDEYWSNDIIVQTVLASPSDLPYSDINIYKAILPEYYKTSKFGLKPKVTSASKQKHIDIVSEESFYSSLIAEDKAILDSMALGYINGLNLFLYPDIRLLAVKVLLPTIPTSVDAFGWETDLGMTGLALRTAILEIMTKDFQLNAAAVSDIVSDMKDQLLIMNQYGKSPK